MAGSHPTDAEAAQHNHVSAFLYAGETYEAKEEYCSAETQEELVDLCGQYSVQVCNLEKQHRQGTREWIRIQRPFFIPELVYEHLLT
jgi:hypothetical protein